VTKTPCCRSYEERTQVVFRLPVEARKVFFFSKESKPIVYPTKPSTECETRGTFPGVLLNILAWRAQGKCSTIKKMFGKYGISLDATAPHWARASSFNRFLDHTQRRTTVGRTYVDE